MEKPSVLILGKLPPPLMGPAIATEIILQSDLRHQFDLHHFDTRINAEVADMGKFRWDKIRRIRALYARFSQTLNHVQPDLVLVPIAQTTAGFLKDLPFIRMASKSGAKVVAQLRGSEFRTWFDKLDPLLKNMVKAGLEKLDGVIVLGENLRGLFQGLVSDEKIFVVANGADYRFPQRRTHVVNVLYLANYLPGKGIREVLDAAVRVKEHHRLRFDFYGYGSWDNPSYRKECLQRIERYPNFYLNKSISGDAKWQALADADVFVFTPNAPEGHPWSVVEASAAGLPIVSTDRGAIRQNVINGKNGFLLEHPDPESIAGKLALLIDNKDLRVRMGEASRSIYEERFTAKSMSDAMNEVFTSILNRTCVES
jgi:glycosyltransferase involved in cell wall biosynthesis